MLFISLAATLGFLIPFAYMPRLKSLGVYYGLGYLISVVLAAIAGGLLSFVTTILSTSDGLSRATVIRAATRSGYCLVSVLLLHGAYVWISALFVPQKPFSL